MHMGPLIKPYYPLTDQTNDHRFYTSAITYLRHKYNPFLTLLFKILNATLNAQIITKKKFENILFPQTDWTTFLLQILNINLKIV